jgi:hypothetical protein
MRIAAKRREDSMLAPNYRKRRAGPFPPLLDFDHIADGRRIWALCVSGITAGSLQSLVGAVPAMRRWHRDQWAVDGGIEIRCVIAEWMLTIISRPSPGSTFQYL